MFRQNQLKLLDHYRRQFFIKYEIKQKILKSSIKNKFIPLHYRIFLRFQLVKLQKITSLTKARNRCLITGRVWNVLKKAQYSRFVFRKESNFGHLPGVNRLSR